MFSFDQSKESFFVFLKALILDQLIDSKQLSKHVRDKIVYLILQVPFFQIVILFNRSKSQWFD